jgi:hypothetical protein
MATIDMDGRTALARHELLGGYPSGRKAMLDQVRQSLDGVDERTRRKGLLLVTALADQWSALATGGEQKLSLRIDRLRDRVHITASASGGAVPVMFWEVIGGAAAAAFADDWETERDGSGAWFDIWPIGP